MPEFIQEKDHFDNGHKKWDGFKCPSCGKIWDPDEVGYSDKKLICPGCLVKLDC